MNIFVSNLNFKTTQEELKSLFNPFGIVESCVIITDKVTKKSRGFGFVEINDGDGMDAINSLDGTEFMGRKLSVSVAKPRKNVS